MKRYALSKNDVLNLVTCPNPALFPTLLVKRLMNHDDCLVSFPTFNITAGDLFIRVLLLVLES